MKQFALLVLIPTSLGVITFFGNFFFFEYQSTKASVLLNESKLAIYNSQIQEIKDDLKSVKDSQQQIINILLEGRK
jgi:capsular polysaccharide biosynthesis protein